MSVNQRAHSSNACTHPRKTPARPRAARLAILLLVDQHIRGHHALDLQEGGGRGRRRGRRIWRGRRGRRGRRGSSDGRGGGGGRARGHARGEHGERGRGQRGRRRQRRVQAERVGRAAGADGRQRDARLLQLVLHGRHVARLRAPPAGARRPDARSPASGRGRKPKAVLDSIGRMGGLDSEDGVSKACPRAAKPLYCIRPEPLYCIRPKPNDLLSLHLRSLSDDRSSITC